MGTQFRYILPMRYLLLLPSLIAGLAVCVEDVRARRVPRLWVAAGWLVQLVVLIVAYVWSIRVAGGAVPGAAIDSDPGMQPGANAEPAETWERVQHPAISLALSLGSGLVLWLCGRVRRGSLGLGDVTCTVLMGLAVGSLGLDAVAVWWLAMSVLGLAGLMVMGVAATAHDSRHSLPRPSSRRPLPPLAPKEPVTSPSLPRQPDPQAPVGGIPFTLAIVAGAILAGFCDALFL